MSVGRSFAVLGLGEVIARLIGFAATVWAIRALGAPTFGVIGVAAATLLYLNRVTDFGFDLGFGVRETAARPEFIAEGLATVLLLRTAIGVVLALGTGLVAWLWLPAVEGAVLAVYALTLLAAGLSCRWVLLGERQATPAAVATTLGQLLMALLVLALVRGPGDVALVPAAQVAGDLLAAVLWFVALRPAERRLPLAIWLPRIRPLIPRAWALVLSALLGIVIYNTGFLVLRTSQGTTAVGYWAAAYTLITFFLNLGQAYNLSLLPALTRRWTEGDRPLELYHRSLAQLYAGGLPLAVGGSLLAGGIVGLLYGPGYAAAALPFAVLIWSVPLNLLRDVPLMGLVAAGQERLVSRITGLSAGLQVALALLLIPPFGMPGAAAATLVTEAVRMGLALGGAGRQGFTPPPSRRFLRATIAAAGMAAALLAVAGRPVWLTVPLGGVVYLGLLWASGGIRLGWGRIPELSV